MIVVTNYSILYKHVVMLSGKLKTRASPHSFDYPNGVTGCEHVVTLQFVYHLKQTIWHPIRDMV